MNKLLLPPLAALLSIIAASPALAGTALSFPVTTSEAVTVTGTPRLALDIGGVTRYATYASGSGTNTLTFTYNSQAGDLDLDGIAITSPLDLNGGTIKDLGGNAVSPLTFTLPNTSNVKVDYPSLSMDAINNDYILNGTHYASLAAFVAAGGGSYTRASVGTYFDAAGDLQTATNDIPRFDHTPLTGVSSLGLLLEENRINYIKNSTMQGAVVGSPGTIPTNWLGNAGGGATETITVVGKGTFKGFSYVDLRFQGSMPATGAWFELTFDNGTSVAITSANYATASVYLALIAGSLPASVSYVSSMYNGATYLSNVTFVTIPPASVTSTLTRFTGTAAPGNVSTTRVLGERLVVGTTGTPYAYDFTLRVAAPQFELGRFASSFIPTTGAAVTRAADSLTLPTGSWYNQNAGSFMENVAWVTSAGAGFPMMWKVDDGTVANRWNLFFNQGSNQIGIDSYAAGVGQGYFSQAASVSGTAKVAAVQALNSANASFNGALRTPVSSWTPPAVTTFRLGTSFASYWLANTKYYPARVADTQLQLLTQ